MGIRTHVSLIYGFKGDMSYDHALSCYDVGFINDITIQCAEEDLENISPGVSVVGLGQSSNCWIGVEVGRAEEMEYDNFPHTLEGVELREAMSKVISFGDDNGLTPTFFLARYVG